MSTGGRRPLVAVEPPPGVGGPGPSIRTARAPRTPGPWRRFTVLVRIADRETLRDTRLVLLVLVLPLLVVGVLAALSGLAEEDGPFTVQVADLDAASLQTAAALGAEGHVVTTGTGRSAAPGPGVDATVVVRHTPDLTVRIVVAERSPAAGRVLAATVSAALPAATVSTSLPDGSTPYDPAAFLLPGALPLAVLLLALPGTGGRVVRWRATGALRLLVTAGGGAGGLHWALLPSRALLSLVAAGSTVLVCAATGVLAPADGRLPALAVTAVLGTLCLLVAGSFVATLLRSEHESRVLLWLGVGVTSVFCGILLPFFVVPAPAAAVLGWTPTAVFADAWRSLLTGTTPEHPVTASWSLLLAVAVGAAWATDVACRRQARPH